MLNGNHSDLDVISIRNNTVISDFIQLLDNIDSIATANVLKTVELIQILREKQPEHLTKKEISNLKKELVAGSMDSKMAAGKKDDFINAVLQNSFDDELWFQELWFGDFYDLTGLDALIEFLKNLQDFKEELEALEMKIEETLVGTPKKEEKTSHSPKPKEKDSEMY